MTPIQEQRQIIDKLYRLLRTSIEEPFNSAVCEFDYFVSKEDGSSSIGSKVSYHQNGNKKFGRLKYPDDEILYDEIPQLHSLMKAHTGGDWNAFTLTINEDGSVTTKFKYPDKDS